LSERLFKVEDVANATGDFKEHINESSVQTIPVAYAEPALAQDPPDARFQFIRMGYFYADSERTPGQLIFNRTVTLKDTWAKEVAKG
jgi:glutaminyl-tRNA synthetase